MTRKAHRAVLLALGVTLVGACAEALGIKDYQDAVEDLCGVCTDIPDCRTKLEATLGAASDADVRDWLSRYKDLGCDTANCKTTGLECFYSAPGNCAAKDAACEASEGCCGFDFDKPKDGAGCCAKDGGTCCDHCISCAEAFGKMPADFAAVCRSQQPALQDVVDCRAKNCKDACATPGAICNQCMTNDCKIACATPGSACDSCKAKSCKTEVDTCNSNLAP